MRHFRSLYLLRILCLLCIFSILALAQDDPNFETGLKAFGSY
jgi:hypothetical protein